MKTEWLLTDEAVLEEIGRRLKQRRLDLQLTQEILADEAGVSKRTVERIEAGKTAQMSTLIQRTKTSPFCSMFCIRGVFIFVHIFFAIYIP